MEKVQQQLSERDTYTPTDVFQVCSPVAMSLNKDENLSEHGSETSDNSLDGNNSRHIGSSDLRVRNIVYVLNMRGQPFVDIDNYMGGSDSRTTFKTTTSARKFARRYMKSHPKG